MDSKILAVLVVALLVGGGLGFGGAYLLYNPQIKELATELDGLESQYESLSDEHENLTGRFNTLYEQHETISKEYEELSEQYDILSDELETTIVNHNMLETQYEELETNYGVFQTSYQSMWEKYDELIKDYNNLSFVTPVGKMIITEIPGVINGDFEEDGEGWVKQGKGGIGWGAAYLHQYDYGTFLTQTVAFDSKDQGLAFLVKPAPVGAEVSLQVSLGGVMVFSETYEGINADFDWERIVIPVKALFEMREYYGFEAEGKYEIRFTVPPGEDNGARILIDDVTLVTIEYQPEEPELN